MWRPNKAREIRRHALIGCTTRLVDGNDRRTTFSRPHSVSSSHLPQRTCCQFSSFATLPVFLAPFQLSLSLDVSTTALRSRFPRFPIQHTVNPSTHPPDGLERRSIRRFTLDGNCLSPADSDMAFYSRVYPPFDLGDIMFVPRSLKRGSFAS